MHLDNTQIVKSQGGLSKLRVEVTVLRAHHVPRINKQFSLKRRFFVTVVNHATIQKTQSVQIDGQTVHWNQKLGALSTQRSSHLTLCLYEKRYLHADVVIGTHEIPIPVESQNDIPVVLGNGDGEAGKLTQPVTLYLTITVLSNAASSTFPNNPPEIPTRGDGSPAEEYSNSAIVSGSGGPTIHTSPDPLLPSSDPLAVETAIPMPDGQAEMSPTEKALIALHRADEAKKPVDRKNKWKGAVSRIKWVMDAVSPIAELHPFAKMAYGMVSTIPEILLEQYQRDDNVLALFGAMHDAFDFAHHEDTLKSIKPDSKQAEILTMMLRDVCSCSDFIQSYAEDSQFWKRVLKNTIGGGVADDIEDLSAALVQRRRAFLDQATITTEITAFRILDGVGILSAKVDGISTQLKWVSSQVSNAELDAKIREIPYGTGSRFTPDKGCLTGTRVAFLDSIVNWVNDPASERSLVLFGQAGTGKSSIAHEIARRFDKMHRLTSSFIFLRKEQSKREAYHLFTTLSRDLSDRYPSFKAALGNVIEDNSSLRVGTRDYPTLFQSLILEPLKDLHIVGPILVVIDALDECGDVTGENGLHKFLAKNLSRLPSNFRVLITSRLEDGIGSAFVGAPSVRVRHMDDFGLAASTHADILTFLQTRLHSDELNIYCDALATKAEGLFQWAAVACGYILEPPEFFDFSRIKCVEHLLKPTADQCRPDPLDELYEEVLTGYFRHQGARRLFRSVVGQLIAAFEPLSIRSLINLRQHSSTGDDSDPESVRRMLCRLSSLLANVNSSDQNLPILLLHTSFRDFLTNEAKSGDFYVDLRHPHRHLAHSCLGLVLHELKFNICGLESSYLANNDVQDLKSRIAKYVPPALLYACRFWDNHLERIDFEIDLFVRLRAFFEKKFLFWLEALSVTSNVGEASPALSALNMWLLSGQGVFRTEIDNFREFINDASSFVRYFGIPMAKSAPHVYLSALPFAPTRSLVSAHYSGSFPRILRVERGRLTHWPSSEMVLSNAGGDVYSIAISPDGQWIVSGSSYGTICMWNAMTGETTPGAFDGHWDSVMSVVFSPDGQRIASGSADETIRVWNAATGEIEAGPFTGHTSSVWSVAFSPDGRRIVSGSEDQTIRMWDATTGGTEAGQFTGHTDWVVSMAFSPNGRYIVSGSGDHTVRVWNAATGETEGGPFTGHASTVWSVAFSPDSQSIVSGSEDRTIRVWNATTGETVAGPFTGHMGLVYSVAFSPDGQRIVSGSEDKTIRVWHATTGATMAGPLTGHTEPVRSVAFSPDGQRIISGSEDRTIRVWNANMRETWADPSTGHESWVWSVAFSPDGQRIASASNDRTIRVWNATTGGIEAGPFTGHTNLVRSVAFSPDGQRIVSGSDDWTIRVWDATTGETVAGPFTGQMSWRIVSGLYNHTIRVLDATTGETVAGPFIGHTDLVESVAFSPDGQRIVSGSVDRTIRIWNATTGETVAGPLTEHTELVWSVAFSPDGQRIVSGSDDGTIRVWNPTTGETVAGPFTDSEDSDSILGSVRSVAFSPDGQHIVSGNYNGEIRVRDATTGEMVAGPFTGHTDPIRSVAFSPDGQRVVSCSEDRTIRVWLTMMGTTEAGLFIGCMDLVGSVAFSPDGNTETTRIVDFTDHSVMNEEGWICGNNGELLMWIPPLHRKNLHRPSNIWVAGEYETRVDLSTFVHGRNWTTCINT